MHGINKSCDIEGMVKKNMSYGQNNIPVTTSSAMCE